MGAAVSEIGVGWLNPVGPLGTVPGGRVLGSGKSRPTTQDGTEKGLGGLRRII